MTDFFCSAIVPGLQGYRNTPATRPIHSTKLISPPPPTRDGRKAQTIMSEMQAMKLAREFARKCDNALQKAANAVEDLINEGYTPDDALMLAGFGGYGFDN